MSQNLKINSVEAVCGAGTFTFTVKVAGPHYVSAQTIDNPPSNMSIVINLNGSPVASSPALDQSRHFIGIDSSMYCNVSDVITVVLSASDINDLLPNTLKTMIRLSYGAI